MCNINVMVIVGNLHKLPSQYFFSSECKLEIPSLEFNVSLTILTKNLVLAQDSYVGLVFLIFYIPKRHHISSIKIVD